MVAESPDASGLTWLQGQDVIRPDGAVMSWVNPDHPAYPYPEIAGYMLSLLAGEGPDTVATRNPIADRLGEDVSADGGVGRAGIRYVFDTAMVLSGALTHEDTGGRLPDSTMPARLSEFIMNNLEAKRAMVGASSVDPEHWSTSYGCHLLKTVLALTSLNDRHPQQRSMDLVGRLTSDLLPLFDAGRFRVNDQSTLTYMHANCYAIEGLLVLDGRGIASMGSLIHQSADWLASVQLEDGGMPSSHDGTKPVGPAHSDCTAQAVRIWACVDRDRYGRSIERGVDFLGRMSKNGGIRYREGSDDINTWATIFAVQAFRWARNGGSWKWMI